MRTTRPWLRRIAGTVVTLAVLAAAQPALAANELAIKTLNDQARYWLGKGRGDLAREAWKKLLLLDPNNVDALASLAQLELDNNRIEASRAYVERLKQTEGGSVAARRIEAGAASKSVDSKGLEAARTAAKTGRADEAVKDYRNLFGGKTPSGPLALEYFQTLGGTDAGWEEARQGLARLHDEDPNNRQVSLAYAQHLSYRAATRREAIHMLSQLAHQPELAKAATEAWRKALIWLDASRSDEPLFQAYLSSAGADSAVRNRLDSLTHVEVAKLDPKVVALRQGFTALNSGDLDQASAQFEKLLADNPNNTDAIGGLGVIRLKQERFADAEKLLSQATRGGQNTAKWGTALNSARFWLEVDAAKASRAAGQNDQAFAQYTRAQRLDPTQTVPILGLADILAEQGKLAEAEKSYRSVLDKEPQSIDALRGLLGVMAQQGRIDDAAAMAERLTPQQREQLGGYGTLKAEQLRRAAVAASARGDQPEAVRLLEDALLWDPTSPWLRLELGRLYEAAGALADARAVVDGLLVSNPNMPSALYASALMSAEAEDWLGGLDQLERIPVASRTKEMLALQRRLWVRAQAERASVLARSGQVTQARQLLREVEPAAERDGELLGAIAQAYSDAGEDNRALATLRVLIARNVKPDLGLMVQYAAILLKTGQDAELATQMRQLYAQPLSERQRVDLDKIRVAYSLHQFDIQRENNNIAAAYDILMPLLTERPDDLTLQLALARLYASAREYKDALAWYDYALQRDPNNLDALVAASGAALAVPNLSYAESTANNAAQIAPDNPTVLTALGKVYRAQGKTSLATQTFQRALIAYQKSSQQAVSGPLGLRLINYTLPGMEGGAQAPASTNGPVIPRIAPPASLQRSSPVNGMPALRPVGLAPATAAPSYAQAAPAVQPLTRPQALQDVVPVQYTYPQYPNQIDPSTLRGTTILPSQTLQTITPPQQRQLQMIQPVQAQVPELAPPYNLVQPPATRSNAFADGSTLSPLPPRVPTVGTTKETLQLREEIDELNAERSGSVAAGPSWRIRSGAAGTSALTEISNPIETRLSFGDGGHMVLRVTPVLLSSGQIDNSDLNAAQTVGANAFAVATNLSSNFTTKQQAGLGLAVGYETLNLKMDIGTSPLGFSVLNVVGGVAYNERIGPITLKLDASRRSVTDSLLSYAGMTDAITGTVWGGVTATGARAELDYEQDRIGFYGYGSYHLVAGRNVANNNRYEGGAGGYYKLINETNTTLSAGVAMTAMGYSQNLGAFTLGQGGYFSPQQYLSVGVPVEWAGRTGQLSYKLDGALGVQYFRENNSNYFPNNSALQGAWAAEAGTASGTAGTPAGVTWKTVYPGQTKTGLGFRLSGSAEYRLAPKWTVGSRLAMDNASNYFQASGLLYLRYNFDGTNRPVSFPPKTLGVNP